MAASRVARRTAAPPTRGSSTRQVRTALRLPTAAAPQASTSAAASASTTRPPRLAAPRARRARRRATASRRATAPPARTRASPPSRRAPRGAAAAATCRRIRTTAAPRCGGRVRLHGHRDQPGQRLRHRGRRRERLLDDDRGRQLRGAGARGRRRRLGPGRLEPPLPGRARRERRHAVLHPERFHEPDGRLDREHPGGRGPGHQHRRQPALRCRSEAVSQVGERASHARFSRAIAAGSPRTVRRVPDSS